MRVHTGAIGQCFADGDENEHCHVLRAAGAPDKFSHGLRIGHGDGFRCLVSGLDWTSASHSSAHDAQSIIGKNCM